MANGDPRTMTPGSEVADVLQQILARKRDETRQAMLDRLAADEQRSVQQSREANDERLRQVAEAQVAESGERLFQSKKGDLRRGTTYENIGDDALRQELEKRGAFESLPIQGPTMSGEGDLGSVKFYKGTDKEEQDELQRTMYQRLAAENPDLAPGLGVLEAGGPAIGSMLTRRVPLRVMRPEDMSVREIPDVQVPESDAVHFLPYRPIGSGGAANARKPYQAVDASGKPLGTVWLNPEEGKQFSLDNPGVELRGVNYQAKTPPQIPASLRNVLTKAQENLTFQRGRDSSRWFADSRGPSTDTTAAEAQVRTAVGQILAADPNTTANVIDAVTAVLTDPDLAGIRASELELQDENGQPIVLTPQELIAIDKALAGFSGISLSGGNE